MEFSHPGAVEEVKLGVISVARPFIPGNKCAIDKTMEETFMKHAKSKGGAGGLGAGICGLTKIYAAYHRWGRTLHEKCKFVDITNSLADLDKSSSDSHKELRPIEVKKGEQAVKNAMEALTFFCQSFYYQ